MPNQELRDYTYRGARALVLLHDRAMRELLPVWRKAKSSGVRLPKTSEPDYASLEALLLHALTASRGYLIWLCQKLGLPDPGMDPPPALQTVEQDAAAYMNHLLEHWRLPLAGVEEKRFFETHKTSHEDMSCEAMLEHAVMHPVRHRFQLEELMETQRKGS